MTPSPPPLPSTPTKGHATTLADENNMNQDTTPKAPRLQTQEARARVATVAVGGCAVAINIAIHAYLPETTGWQDLVAFVHVATAVLGVIIALGTTYDWVQAGE